MFLSFSVCNFAVLSFLELLLNMYLVIIYWSRDVSMGQNLFLTYLEGGNPTGQT